MSSSNTDTVVAQQSYIDEILSNKPTLSALFSDPGFMTSFYSQKPKLIEYLSKTDTIRQMIEYMYDIDKISELTYKQQCDYPFVAFNILSNVNPTITEVLYKNNELLQYFFSIERRNMDGYMTSQGYFQATVKNMLSDVNAHNESFVKVLKIDAERRIFPLVRNLSKANAEILKEILVSTKSYIKKLQTCVFEYLLFYFLNEQFKDTEEVVDMFENLNDLFEFLRRENVKYNYKIKYEYTLYSDKYVKNRKYKREIYGFKLVLLKYIAETKQIMKCQNPHVFLTSYKDYKQFPKFLFLLNNLVEFFRILSFNEDFVLTITPEFISDLIEIIKISYKNDIIHKHAFTVLYNLSKYISTNKAATTIVVDFLVELKPELKNPKESKGFCNRISLDFVYKLLESLNFNIIDLQHKEMLMQWKISLTVIFTKLCFDPSADKLPNVDDSTDIQVIINNNFKLTADNTEDDAHDYCEDRIMKPEPMRSPIKAHVYFNVRERNYKDYDNIENSLEDNELDSSLDKQLYSTEELELELNKVDSGFIDVDRYSHKDYNNSWTGENTPKSNIFNFSGDKEFNGVSNDNAVENGETFKVITVSEDGITTPHIKGFDNQKKFYHFKEIDE